ncbi:MAG: histidine kinase [Eubacteriales bacterium]|nr:histidine kinase [Eubacteriales bacterium]
MNRSEKQKGRKAGFRGNLRVNIGIALAVAILIIGILGQFAYVSSERAVLQTYRASYGNALQNSSRVLDMNLQNVIEVVRSFLNEPQLKAVLEGSNQVLPGDFSYTDRKSLEDVGKTLAQQNAAVNCILFMDLQGNHYLLNNVNQGTYEFDRYYQEHSLLKEPWVQASRDAKGRELFWGEDIFGTPMRNVFYMTKYLINPSNGRPMGYLVVALSKSMISRSFVNNSGSYESSISYVMEPKGEQLIISQGSEEQKAEFEESLEDGSYDEVYVTSNVSNKTTGWELVNGVKRYELGSESRRLRINVWLGGGIVLIIIFSFLGMFLTNQRLTENLMAAQLNERESELMLLQAQINPHFLYNTLDSLYFVAIIHGDDQIADMTMALSEHFKLTLNSGKPYMTIGNTLQWIRGYLKIMNMRFHDRFSLVEEVDPDLMEKEILKFLIQPIVENAMYHGLEPKIGKGMIRIVVEKAENGKDIRICIEDDGVGMEDPAVWESGYGIRNVKERIRLHYGSAYGIQVESKRNEGTRVTLTVPAE